MIIDHSQGHHDPLNLANCSKLFIFLLQITVQDLDTDPGKADQHRGLFLGDCSLLDELLKHLDDALEDRDRLNVEPGQGLKVGGADDLFVCFLCDPRSSHSNSVLSLNIAANMN